MTDHSGTPGTGWLEHLIRTAWPETAGVTLAALDALGEQDVFTGRQLAYVAKLMMMVGAQARTDGDRAEVLASCEARFEPRATREARIALRLSAVAEQHEIAWLRRTGEPAPEPWPGGTPDEALARYGWGDR